MSSPSKIESASATATSTFTSPTSSSSSTSALSPPKWIEWTARGLIMMEASNYTNARLMFTRAINFDPTSPMMFDLLDRLAQAHTELGQLNLALRYALTGLAIVDITMERAWLRLGLVFEAFKEYSAALTCAHESIHPATKESSGLTLPTTAKASQQLLARTKKLGAEKGIGGGELVLLACRLILNSNSTVTTAAADDGDNEIDLRRAVRLQEEGNRLYKNDDTKLQAMENWKKALDFFTPRAFPLMERADCCLKLDRQSNVVHDALAALTLDPALVSAQHYLADALFQKTEYQLAMLACEQGLQMPSADEEIITSFTQLMSQISTLDSTSESSLSWLTLTKEGKALSDAQDYKSAISSFTRALAVMKHEEQPLLLSELLAGICLHYARKAKSAIDRGQVPSSHDLISTAAYHFAASNVPTSAASHRNIGLTSNIMESSEFTEAMMKVMKCMNIVGKSGDHTCCMAKIIISIRVVITHQLSQSAPQQVDTEPRLTIEEALALFKQGQAILKKTHNTDTQGVKRWLRALKAFTPRAIILSNRAFVHIKLESWIDAMIDTVLALLIDPTDVEVMLHQATALCGLREYDLVRLLCERGMKMTKERKVIEAFNEIKLSSMREAVSAALAATSSSSSSSSSSSHQCSHDQPAA